MKCIKLSCAFSCKQDKSGKIAEESLPEKEENSLLK